MADSPLEQLMDAVDRLDADGVVALMQPDIRFLSVDGQRAEGVDAVRKIITDFLAQLRSTSHEVTAQWHEGDTWIAEMEANYELRDWLQINRVPRVLVARIGSGGIADLRAYGAHEQPLSEHRSGEEGMRIGGRWIPPL